MEWHESEQWNAVGAELYFGPIAPGTLHHQMPSGRIAALAAASPEMEAVCRGVLAMLGPDYAAYKVGELAKRVLTKIERGQTTG